MTAQAQAAVGVSAKGFDDDLFLPGVERRDYFGPVIKPEREAVVVQISRADLAGQLDASIVIAGLLGCTFLPAMARDR